MNEEINIDFENFNFDDFANIEGWENYWGDISLMGWDISLMSPWFEWLMFLILLLNILWFAAYISSAIWLYLINKKLWEKHAWLSFVPILQVYNYFTASKKSWIHYLLFPVIWLIVWWIFAFITFWISMLVAYIYFIVMLVKLLHAISVRTWRWVWTTIWLFFIPFIMLPIIWVKMKDKSNIENNNENNEAKDEL